MAIAVIDNVPFKHDLDKAELTNFLKRLNFARLFVQDKSSFLINAIGNDDKAARDEAVIALMETNEARLAASIRANRALPVHKRASLENCVKIADALDLSKPIKEPVRCWRKPKANGYRIIHDPGLVHRTAQQLVRRVMDKFFVPRLFQYTHLGVHSAIKEVKKLIGEGHVYGAHLDIRDFYGSFEMERLTKELPLPEGAVKHAVVGRYMELDWVQDKSKGRFGSPSSPHLNDLLCAQARLGMPQGSVCSSIIGAWFVSRLKWNSMGDVAMANYVDDFQLLAKSHAALVKAVEELTASVGQIQGGTFSVGVKQQAHVAQGITFLGRALQLTNGELRVSPSPKAMECFYKEMDGLDHKLMKIVFHGGAKLSGSDKANATELLADYSAKIRGWGAAFQECSLMSEFLAPAWGARDQWLKDVGVAEAELQKYANVYEVHSVDGYVFKN